MLAGDRYFQLNQQSVSSVGNINSILQLLIQMESKQNQYMSCSESIKTEAVFTKIGMNNIV